MAARATDSSVRPGGTNIPSGGILVGTMVRTLDGVLPVEFLSPGDRIVCRQGARRLLGVTARHLDRADLVRIRASSLGHDRPDSDLLLSPDQPVLIRDWRAKVLFGQPVAAIPAARLVDGEFILAETRADARLFSLQFADDEVIYAEGLELACPAHVPMTVALSA